MRFQTKFAVLAVLVLFAATTALAQTTATLTGTVTTDGTPLPGATVTISSPALQGTRTTVTGENGGYVFPSLPPGDYTVKFELEGLQPVSKPARLQLAQTARADAELKLGALAEAITVTASASSVLETPQVATNLDGELVDKLPINRTVLAAALLAPGVNDKTVSLDQLSISGSPGYDNLVMVNGVVITENVRSQATRLFIEDAIQETTVLTGAISAEYGRFTGGVVNSITKSGGNQFFGSFRDSRNNAAWTKVSDFGEPKPLDKDNDIYEATLGGFILRDRLWFFGAGRQEEDSISRTTRFTILPYSTTSEETRYEAKLTGQITAKHNIVGSYLDKKSDAQGTRFTAAIYDLASLTAERLVTTPRARFTPSISTSTGISRLAISPATSGTGPAGGSRTTCRFRGSSGM